tara:strand:- start:959 stop:1363 length:405 start_codon:yes stop_codon:yes gene_type:complete
MKFFFIFPLFFITSCVSVKYPHNYFAECERKFNDFSNISSCALEKIQDDCKTYASCGNENTRFVDIMKRLKTMLNNDEISDNEAMFRYFNLIDFEESKFKSRKITNFNNYRYYPNSFYLRGFSSCYYSTTGFCY